MMLCETIAFGCSGPTISLHEHWTAQELNGRSIGDDYLRAKTVKSRWILIAKTKYPPKRLCMRDQMCDLGSAARTGWHIVGPIVRASLDTIVTPSLFEISVRLF